VGEGAVRGSCDRGLHAGPDRIRPRTSLYHRSHPGKVPEPRSAPLGCGALRGTIRCSRLLLRTGSPARSETGTVWREVS
jgi:hypothetical protein